MWPSPPPSTPRPGLSTSRSSGCGQHLRGAPGWMQGGTSPATSLALRPGVWAQRQRTGTPQLWGTGGFSACPAAPGWLPVNPGQSQLLGPRVDPSDWNRANGVNAMGLTWDTGST